MLITEPKIYWVTFTQVDWDELERFLKDEGKPGLTDSIRAGFSPSEGTIEVAGRMCYDSYSNGRKEIADFVTNLLKARDGSVLEHVSYGFIATGISRSLSHEQVRHRVGIAYSQRSQRYVDEGAANYVVPPFVLTIGQEAVDIFDYYTRLATEGYSKMIDILAPHVSKELSKTDARKAVRSAARSVLPNATETKIDMTANVRTWRNMLEQRCSPSAEIEIRRLYLRILRMLQAKVPLFFGDFTISTHKDGTEIAVPFYSRV